jgi:uncharacterized protein DUF5681
MSNNSKQPRTAQPSDGPASAVGYGRPPVHTRFRKGQSGNPKGRRKGQRNIHTVVDEVLRQRITIREGDRVRSLSKLDGVVVTMVNSALKGDAKALTTFITTLRALGMTGEPPAVIKHESFTADDQSILEDFLRRRGSELQQPTEIESNQRPMEPSILDGSAKP